MPSPEEIAAKIEQLAELEGYARVIIDADIPTLLEAAALLRAANPPINSESSPAPATPAVGEDNAALLSGLDMLAHYQCDPGVTCGIAAKSRDKISALLADVARLTEDRCEASELALHALADLKKARSEAERLTAVHSDLFRENERLRGIVMQNDKDWQALRGELTEARATLAAVRKVAEDPMNAHTICANEILNVLEGNHEPRR